MALGCLAVFLSSGKGWHFPPAPDRGVLAGENVGCVTRRQLGPNSGELHLVCIIYQELQEIRGSFPASRPPPRTLEDVRDT